jgi:hypothetical protein
MMKKMAKIKNEVPTFGLMHFVSILIGGVMPPP